jgi:diguanylate cyclase (GGDEF)-like protein
VLTDRLVVSALVLTSLSILWFAAGPANGQLVGVRLVTPALAGLAAAGLWLVAADCRLPVATARFWRVLSLAIFTYTAGMIVDLVVLVLNLLTGGRLAYLGEQVLYPIAAVVTIVAFVAFPVTKRAVTDRVKIGLDLATVLFGTATFVWYFFASRNWHPPESWGRLFASLILPALTLVAGFAILRITTSGANVISKPTTVCFVLAVAFAATSVFVIADAWSVAGRLGSMMQAIALMSVVVGVVVQRRAEPPRLASSGVGWRRPFTVLPYGALLATVALLLMVIEARLDYRGWLVAIGVLALCGVVMARQLVSLWENSRLLSDNRDLTGRLRHEAYYDHLTGLVNRTPFTERVSEALVRVGDPSARPRDANRAVAVLFVDLDDFKIVNDSLGHQAGDDLLVAVGRRLRETVGATDTLGRLGGDEFAILIEDASSQSIPAMAERVIAALSSPLRLADIQVRVGASVGIAIAWDARTTCAELLRNADVAMYAVKNTQKGGWQIFEPAMLTGLLDRHHMRAALVQAVERDEFIVHYQPIVDLKDGAVHGAEALVRWQRAAGDPVPPGQFIPLAEEIGLIAEIDRGVLLEACRQAVGWRAHSTTGKAFALHVNLSARQLHRPDLVTDVDLALRESGLPAERLTLEITESGLGHDHDGAIERLSGLKRLGVQLAIDDFGTGYSSLAYLRRMPIDVLKIDKTFIDELLDETVTTPLAQVVVAFAAALNLETVAEGIEQPMQAARLVDFGCRLGQGFHFAHPLTGDQMAALLEGGGWANGGEGA